MKKYIIGVLSFLLLMFPMYQAKPIDPATIIMVAQKAYSIASSTKSTYDAVKDIKKDDIPQLIFQNICIPKYDLTRGQSLGMLDLNFNCDYDEFSVYQAFSVIDNIKRSGGDPASLKRELAPVLTNKYEYYRNDRLSKVRSSGEMRSMAKRFRKNAKRKLQDLKKLYIKKGVKGITGIASEFSQNEGGDSQESKEEEEEMKKEIEALKREVNESLIRANLLEKDAQNMMTDAIDVEKEERMHSLIRHRLKVENMYKNNSLRYMRNREYR